MMDRTTFTVIVAALAALVLLGMWLGWRRRSRRDADVIGGVAPSGELVAEFPNAAYVSTTPAGAPLDRVAAPGLRYRGPATVEVRTDGVTITVAGEQPVHLPAARVLGSGASGARVGKFVERDGITLLRWLSEGRRLESGFRFVEADDHHRFTAAIDRIAAAPQDSSAEADGRTSTTQEDA